MLALADQLQNISAACKRAGISRSRFYEIRAAFENYGRDDLAPQDRRRPRMPNETPPELVEKLLQMTCLAAQSGDHGCADGSQFVR
jgi:hypothetical protein